MAEQKSDGAEAATKVEQAAANVRQARSPRRRITKTSPEAVTRRYFEAIGARDLDTAVALWAEGGRDNVRGQVDVLAPEGVRAFLGELLQAVPDLDFEIVSTTAPMCLACWPTKYLASSGTSSERSASEGTRSCRRSSSAVPRCTLPFA